MVPRLFFSLSDGHPCELSPPDRSAPNLCAVIEMMMRVPFQGYLPDNLNGYALSGWPARGQLAVDGGLCRVD
jgi:hypothetical protein